MRLTARFWSSRPVGCLPAHRDASAPCRQVAHFSQPAERGHRRQAALQTCVYSLHAAEQLLRAADRPLLAEDSWRAHICLRQMVRVCAALLPGATGLEPVRHQCLSLLRCLLRPDADSPTVIEFDAFGAAVMLSMGLPTVAARQEEEGLLSPAGSLQVSLSRGSEIRPTLENFPMSDRYQSTFAKLPV